MVTRLPPEAYLELWQRAEAEEIGLEDISAEARGDPFHCA